MKQIIEKKLSKKPYSPSFWVCRKLSRNDLQRVGTNTWVSSLRILQADTPTRLS